MPLFYLIAIRMNSIELLTQRQSNPHLTAPAPTEEHLDLILQAGMKVPDHASLTPWHFTLVKGDGLQRLSELFVDTAKRNNADTAKVEKAAKMPFRAPLIIIVSTKYIDHEKVPKIEQTIAAGCCVHAMQMAAFALGYGAIWRTGDLSFDPAIKQGMGVNEQDDIVGFLYIGTTSKDLPVKKSKDYANHISDF